MELPDLIDDSWFTGTVKGDSLYGVVAGGIRSVILWARGIKKEVPREIEAWVQEELDSVHLPDDEDPVADLSGEVSRKPGVILRLAEEVRLRFNGTPALTQSNLMLAGRYIREVLEGSKVRTTDRPRVFYKIRALVFTRSHYEREADQILNSKAALKAHDDGTGWGSVKWGWGLPMLQRRVPSAQ